uniref:sideroflexin-2-like n=1 Tax=Styela clava TaxID=7725 RepID=UPI001939D1FB|nr:sideroflexin-2-like [Styela clava]
MGKEKISVLKEFNFDITKPRWDQGTFFGRLRHFVSITDPRLAIAGQKELEAARNLVDDFKCGMMPRGTTVEQIWKARHLEQSAFHPDSGELMNIYGRMSFQVTGRTAITGFLLQFYKTPFQVASMQWMNQSYNALVNYTNRNAASTITKKQMFFAYLTATVTGVGVAVWLNRSAALATPILARWVPLVAVSSANAVNIPLSRQSEIISGIVITDEHNQPVGNSRKCAIKGITQVVISRVVMGAPGFILLPLIVERIKHTKFWRNHKWAHLPFQVMGSGVVLLVMVPISCALFPQISKYKFSKLEPEVQESIRAKLGKELDYVYFNKGL